MKKTKRWLLMTAALLMLITHSAAVAPFKKVALATTTKSTTTTTTTTTTTSTTEAPNAETDDGKSSSPSGPTKNPKLTGIPQIDYIWDPNLPRELGGYNLSTYPFFATTPPEEDIHFKCDGLHDGFYASIEHKCQVYHHCVYGIRHDFLCANFTAFDQKTFICHFASDVDCEGSQKYWNRNDNLYMATTTTTTTTTTTEPPPTPRRRPVRPLRPLRRPQRPVDDYYYDEEQEYDDDYYEERRRKHRPRHRKPSVDDYDDDYYEKRRRPNSRDRFRDEDEPVDDYENDRRKYDRPKSRNNKPERGGSDDRRKSVSRKPGRTDERRSFSEDRPQNGRKDGRNRPAFNDSEEPIDSKPPRRLAGRRRINEKRTSPAAADPAEVDDYDSKPKSHALDQEEAAEEEAPHKVKTTPKPLEDLITPKAAPASVFSRPRAPPRIPRPVPVNEKKKYQYPVQKTATTTSSPGNAHVDDAEYYEDEEYEDTRIPQQRPHHRRRITDESDDETVGPVAAKRRNPNDAPGRKPTRTTLRKPVTDKKPLPADEQSADYDSAVSDSHERYDNRAPPRRRPYASRTRSSARDTDDVDFVDDDYDERPAARPGSRLRPKIAARKSLKKPRPAPPEIEEEADVDAYESEPEPELPPRSRTVASAAGRRRPLAARQRPTASHDDTPPEAEDESDSDAELPPSKGLPTGNAGRTATVRVVKRPFLPSRGGSPYLPRGLQPVGVALKPLGNRAGHTTDSTPIDMGSTISGVRLLEHGAPILRDSGSERAPSLPSSSIRTTLPPRSPIPIVQTRPETAPQQPKITLDELYENDYDVTLNDALNPTLKPLSSHRRNYGVGIGVATGRDATAPASAAIAYATAPVGTAVNSFVNNNNQSPAIYHHKNNNNQNHHNHNNNNHHQLHQNNNYQLPTAADTMHQLQLQQQQQQHQHSNAYQTIPQSHQSSSSSPQSLPLSQSQSQTLTHQQLPQLQLQQSQSQFQQLQQQQQQSLPQSQTQSTQNNYKSDSYFSSTDIRRRAVLAAPPPRTSQTDYRGLGTRIAQHFYDDFDY